MKRRMLTRVLVFALAIACTAGGEVIYVDAHATGANDGSSWADAYKYLQDALADANSSEKPVEIWVAEGVYTPDRTSAEPNGTGDREASFGLIHDVALYGGFPSSGSSWEERDPKVYETILSGDLDGNDVDVDDPCDLLLEPTRGENSYGVVETSYHLFDSGGSYTLDGFTISGANGYVGMHVATVARIDGKVVNCTFRDNLGGGISCDGRGLTTLTDCMFAKNWARAGGAIYAAEGARLSLVACSLYGNRASYGAAVLCDIDSSADLTGCEIFGNSAEYAGGALWSDMSGMDLTNCTVTGNTAREGGGLYCGFDGWVELQNCTLSGNRASYGGVVYNTRELPTVRFSNCIVWGNVGLVEGEFYGSPSASYSDIEGGWPGEGDIDADPCFADPGYWDDNETPEDVNDDQWINGDYHLKSQAGRWDPNSETWVQDDVTSLCIDAGNPCTNVGEEPDPNGGRVNMGAYGGTAEASKSIAFVPECFPSTYSTHNDWKALGEPCCWCRGYQCDGDADGSTETFEGYRIYGEDLGLIVDNWKRKIDDPELDPCADIDHKAETVLKFRVYGKDLATVVANWKKTDSDLAGDCPRAE